MQIGIISNPESGRNRKSMSKIRGSLAHVPGVFHYEINKMDALTKVLNNLFSKPIDILAINGGDGTVQAVMTALFRSDLKTHIPLLAILPGGSTNMTAYDICGRRRSLMKCLKTLLRYRSLALNDNVLVHRPVLRVQTHPRALPRFGMFFGAGTIIQGMSYCKQRVHTLGVKNELGPALALTRAVLGMISGHKTFANSMTIKVSMNGQDTYESIVSKLVFVSTLNRLVLGMRPYWGQQNDPLHFTLIRNDAACFLRALPGLLMGKPNRYISKSAGYWSQNVKELHLRMAGLYSLDGELYEARYDTGPVILGCAGNIAFLRI